jgi:cobyrinic acid a,c-diamide synthase
MKGLMVAGAASGVGKTTVSLALLAAMRRRGLTVQPFKGGPDFLDTGHHTRIAGRVARNLDTWMLTREANIDVMREASRGVDALLVEGMMGLFDGKSGEGETGSSAEIAKLLKLPVVLVLDAGKSARSIAAVVLGFETFDPQLPLAGIILNRVAGERHYRMLESAIQSRCKTPLLGWLPKEMAITIPERHLGLHTAEEAGTEEETAALIDKLAAMAEGHLDLDRIFSLECGLDLGPDLQRAQEQHAACVRIGVARDHAFSFYYEDNLDLLRQHGAEIVPFSPIHDGALPGDLDALYLGGGYPELYAKQLSSNTAMLTSIRSFAASGKPVYAECGGMVCLAGRLITADGVAHSMAGVLPCSVEMTDRLMQFGYVTVEVTNDCLIAPRGSIVRGHSFHYSRIVNAPAVKTSYLVQYSLSGKEEAEGYSIGNVLASYVHLHFRAAPSIARHLVEAARAAQSVGVAGA